MTPFEWFILIMTVVSTAYSIDQAKKAARDARKAADARRGFEIPTEGQADFLPLVYGRAKIGGVRVYHQTKSDFIYTAPNSDSEHLTGLELNAIRPIIFQIPVSPEAPGYQDPNYAQIIDEYDVPVTRWSDLSNDIPDVVTSE